MTSFQILISPSRRAAARYISVVRRSIQKALAEEKKESGITQSDMARSIGVHRSVINREIRGQKDITLGRVGELAWALGREIEFNLVKPTELRGKNTQPISPGAIPSNISEALRNEIADDAGRQVPDEFQPNPGSLVGKASDPERKNAPRAKLAQTLNQNAVQ